MNKRIKQLLEVAANTTPGTYMIVYETEQRGVRFTDPALEEFVKLVVKECMIVCEQQRMKILDNPDDPSWTEHLAECETIMQQRFEVR